jgi:hypothetical protein
MGKWRKRTEEEIEASFKIKDYTGGYEFGPWLLWMRKWYVIILLGNMFFAYKGWEIFSKESDKIGIAVGIFFTISSLLISYKIRQDYTNGKKGVSR